MKFCSSCGQPVVQRVPPGDDRERFVCEACGTIHYQNPKIVTGCLPIYEGRVLLCKRAIPPRAGLWTLPAGFLENGETTVEGAIRETREEARAEVSVHGLYTVFNLPHISQIYMFFRADLTNLSFSAGPESADVQLFEESQIPWDELAFPVVRDTLRHYFNDRHAGAFPVRVGDIRYKER
ncbi:MAG: NUDIX domain-containing protein [Gammaproteobacteria bacterium]|nr:MAG: NUDIX domain-containing protein [Gammaproteobacteria bacterium]TDJ43160.1 MAG: NUDIX domain-containing protein [Gammaproteobacteria bacterium]